MLSFGFPDRAINGIDVVAIDVGDDLPAVGGEALGHVVAVPVGDMALQIGRAHV